LYMRQADVMVWKSSLSGIKTAKKFLDYSASYGVKAIFKGYDFTAYPNSQY